MVRILCVIVALGLLTPLTAADDVKSEKPVEKKEFNKTDPLDKEFLVAVHSCCNASDRCLGMVEKASASDAVKDFAKSMKEDHDKLSKKLGQTIKDKKLAAVAGLDKEVNEKLTALGKLDKGEFDRSFIKHVIEGHEKSIKMAENQKANGKDKDITEFAEEMLPPLRDHLKKAKELQKKLD